MKPTEWLVIVFLLQGLAIFIDEFVFHWRRGLPKWERIGHPLDTLSVLLPFVFVLLTPYSVSALWIFAGLAIFSCVLITKDEFVHKELCSGAENWLHAVLFILHPLAFIVAALFWAYDVSRAALIVQTCLVGLCFVYQIVYWSFVWPRLQSTTRSTINSATAGIPLKTIRSRSSELNLD